MPGYFRPFIILLLVLNSVSALGQKNYPGWFLAAFRSAALDRNYQLNAFINPSFLESDFNGDKVPDIAALVVNRKTKKRRIVIIHGGSMRVFVIGAGSMFGKEGFDEFDNLDWLDSCSLFNNRTAYETRFRNGDIVGSIPRKMRNTAISISEIADGAPLAGGIVFWDGKKYSWIHQGE